MRYRLRFIVIHTFVISAILLSAMAVIYFYYAGNRKTTWQNRLQAQAYVNLISFYKITDTDKNIKEKIAPFLPISLVRASVFIFNDSMQLLYKKSTIHQPITPEILQKIQTKKNYFFTIDNQESVGIYYNSPFIKAYTIAVNYDKFGFERLEQLRMITIVTAFLTILLAGSFSLFYVFYITKPLVKLSLQMRSLNEGNLKQKFDIGKYASSKNEMTMIANNFNGMLERLTTSFEMQKSFVHHASHELRTPLAVMLMQTESALRKDLTSEESRKVLLSLKEDQQEMIDLTNSLLLLSQYENASNFSEWPSVRLDEIIYDTIEIIKRSLKNIIISIEFEKLPEDDLNLSIFGNETLLRSSFRNLIKNAYQYSDDKNVRIIFSIEEKFIYIHFDNKGKLVNEKEQPQLFIPFFRSENSANKKGFGLGLSIVRRIIKIHKGTINYSIHNEDTNRFTVAFPNEAATKKPFIN